MDQHGVSIGDYYRCKKLNEIACLDCKAIAAAYRRAQIAKDPEKYKQQDKDYYKRYPHKKTEWNRRKDRKARARLRQVKSVNFSTKDVLDLWGTECHICNTSIDMRLTRNCGEPGWEYGLHLDHVIPLAKGGPNIISNVKPSHATCNIRKSANLLKNSATA
jgi:5-methylcytosine-specific restriction endonuclease McrA